MSRLAEEREKKKKVEKGNESSLSNFSSISHRVFLLWINHYVYKSRLIERSVRRTIQLISSAISIYRLTITVSSVLSSALLHLGYGNVRLRIGRTRAQWQDQRIPIRPSEVVAVVVLG